MNGVAPLLVPVAIYAVAVLGVGLWAGRKRARSPEEYFLAGRTLGPVVLFMALFGTNATAFVFIGVPGKAYHDGVAVFGANAAIVALATPLSFWAIGVPARRLAAELGAVTPAELFAKRFGSRAVGLALFALFTAYTVPYMVSAVTGAAVTLRSMTGDAVPVWVGSVGVVALAWVYTAVGGMRATAWTNVFQGVLFLGFLVAAFFFIAHSLGGFGAATRAVELHDASLLGPRTTGAYAPRAVFSHALLISLTVIAFPHMLVRLLAGGSERAIRTVCRVYSPALLFLWLPPVMIGVWGAAQFPGLDGRESDAIFQLMTGEFLPAWLASLALVAVLAAVMSSLDAMILTLSSMLVRDALPALGFRRFEGRREVAVARGFTLAVGIAVVVLSVVWSASVFEKARFAFAGFVTLTPLLLLGVRWRRFDRVGALASLGAGTVALFATRALDGPWLGFLPVFWGLVAAGLGAVCGTWLSGRSGARRAGDDLDPGRR